ncbi:nicotinate (nicotinamide) nucleotide adenylyltransferase [Alcaligenaceae bacterium CGII-47]|nr:nicotinate (nicotinamide) nucleotide adenylyltransferase [Alcaligenaceae bacterium CGII-47]
MAIKTRIGLLGGSFDPVHRAHIALALAALTALDLTQVQLIPAAQPWQRSPLLASGTDRLRMLELACHNEPRLSINTLELSRQGDTYTIDTLDSLPKTADYIWILGADQLVNFCSWHRWQDILTRTQLAVAQRPGISTSPPPALAQVLEQNGQTLRCIPFEPLDISATKIRQKLANGQAVDDMLDPLVLDYIRAHHLYLDPVSMPDTTDPL